MFHIGQKYILRGSFFLVLFCLTSASLDVYLPKDEVYRLFGVQNAQLFYIHDGKINKNALDFVARVQPEQDVLKYMWQAKNGVAVYYTIKFMALQDPYNATWNTAGERVKIIDEPSFRIAAPNSKAKVVPDKPEVLEVHVRCTGFVSGNVTFTTTIDFQLSFDEQSWELAINVTRLRKCEKNQSIIPDKTPATSNHNENRETDTKPIKPSGGGTQQSTSAFYIAVSVVSSVIVLIVVGVGLWQVRISRRHRSHESEAMHRLNIANQHGNQFLRLDLPNNAQKPPSNSSLVHITPLINDLGTDINELQGKLLDLLLPRSKVTLGDLALKGTFALIYKGVLEDGTTVMVKTVTDAATDEQKRLLLFESSLLRGMHHRNILTVKYIVVDGPQKAPLVLFPFMEGGNLKHFLQSLKLNESPGLVPGFFNSNLKKREQVSTQDLVEMAIQVVCGMTFLSKRNIVHKDLATRNCVIDNDLKIKITDYALSRDTFPSDYCCLGDCENRPVRWLALESLVHKVYSSASDVWSFGVLLWEFQSLAATPYTDIDDFEMAEYLSDGFRLSQPINCPDHLYSIMAGCWHYNPDQRPTFTHLFQLLTEFYAELGDYV